MILMRSIEFYENDLVGHCQKMLENTVLDPST